MEDSKSWAATIIGGLSVVWITIGCLAVLPAMMSPMMFDAPGSGEKLVNLIAFGSVATFPFVCWLSGIFALISAWMKWNRIGYVLCCTPLANLVLFAMVVSGVFGQ